MKEELHLLDCVNTHWVSWGLSRGQTTGDHSGLQEVMGIWVTGTSKVFRKGVEIVMFFDIMLRCLVWCMDEAGDQLSIIRRSSKGGGCWKWASGQTCSHKVHQHGCIHAWMHGTSPTPPRLRGLDFPEQDFIVSSHTTHPQPDPQKVISPSEGEINLI